MKCKNCGYEFDEGIFCPECGTKYDEESEKEVKENIELVEQIEKDKQEEKEVRELELEKTKLELERLAVEKAAHEAELARQENEKERIKQEKALKAEEREKKKQEELTRTFNGVVYNTVEEMNQAKQVYESKLEEEKKLKLADKSAIWCLVWSILTWPLTLTGVLSLPSLVASIVMGRKALKGQTTKRFQVITGFCMDGLYVLILCVSIVIVILES